MSHIITAARKLERESKHEIFGRLEQFFKEADKDNDGFLTLNELTRTLRRYGYKGSEDEIKKFFRMADTSGDDKVSLDEYMFVMKQAPALKHSEAAMRRVFAMFDKDGNGSIDTEELQQVFVELGKIFPEDEIQTMMEVADKDQSGSLEYEEFIQIVMGRKAKSLRQAHVAEQLARKEKEASSSETQRRRPIHPDWGDGVPPDKGIPYRRTPPVSEEDENRRKVVRVAPPADKTAMTEIKRAAKIVEKNVRKEAIQRMEHFFKEADSDKDGYLTLHELTATLRQYGFRGTHNDILKFFHYADTSGDDKVSLEEYMKVMKTAPVLTHTEANMRRVFMKFDRDGNGAIDAKELKQVFEELGKIFSEEEITNMIAMVDADQSGSLEYEEFIEIVMGKQGDSDS